MIQLDVGCGGQGTPYEGFIGVDVWPAPKGNPQPYVQADFLEDGLPWGPCTVDTILVLHVIEHLPRPDAVLMVGKALALLKTGGTLYVTTPDLHELCLRYLAYDWDWWNQVHEGTDKLVNPGPTLSDRLNHAIHHAGREDPLCKYPHQWAYDRAGLRQLMTEAGAQQVEDLLPGDQWLVEARWEVGVKVVKP